MGTRIRVAAALAALGLVTVSGGVLAQGDPSAQPSAPAASPAGSGAVPSLSPACADPAALPLKNPGRLTLSTDNPAYPPWWGGTPPEGSEWSLGYPPSGEGYEGATAAAVAAVLGFTPETTDWLANAEFTAAFAPGDKPFDFHLAQISITPERAEAVDFSDGYFDSVQSVVAVAGTPIASATTIEELKAFRLGAAQGTTSLQLIESVIQPTAEASVFNTNDDLVTAIQNGQVDGGVADLYSAIFMTGVQLENGVVVGKFSPDAQVDQMGMVLQKDSPLTACVNEALAIVKASGQLQQIYDQYIGGGEDIPTFQ
jgi:polar amino acid transport system substrate-binding protein